jgi:formate hydrogenlyase subunit 6/NADH:ubiquinone oxidoreductase subunit I
MLKTVLGNLFSKPATRAYPFERREPFAGTRGAIAFDDEKCTACGACSKKCPAGAIEVDRLAKTLTFHPFQCIVCEACRDVCTHDAIGLLAEHRAPSAEKLVELHACHAAVKVAPKKAPTAAAVA